MLEKTAIVVALVALALSVISVVSIINSVIALRHQRKLADLFFRHKVQTSRRNLSGGSGE